MLTSSLDYDVRDIIYNVVILDIVGVIFFGLLCFNNLKDAKINNDFDDVMKNLSQILIWVGSARALLMRNRSYY